MARRRKRPGTPTFSEEETAEALRQYNEAMRRADDERRAERAARRADARRRDAAEALHRLRDDPTATADDVGAAEAHYRAMVEEWNAATGTAGTPADDATGDASGDADIDP